MLSPSNDLYSLGCVLYAVHMGGKPPFEIGTFMSSLRDFAEGSLVRRDWMSGPKWERQSAELKGEYFQMTFLMSQIYCLGCSLGIQRIALASLHYPHIRSSLPWPYPH
jgi:serine/threonine protein kinase